MTPLNEPRLPPELEENIFLQALDSSPSDAFKFILVAKRVHHWLIPQIFKTVIYHYDESSPIRFDIHSFERYANHVQHLFLEPENLLQYLYLFSNVTNLVLWGECSPAQLEILLEFNHLTHLAVVIGDDVSIPPPIYFALFSKVTHLDLMSSCDFWWLDEIKPNFNFPLLTHLCVLCDANTEVIKLFLDRIRCPNLAVVILWDPSPEAVTMVRPEVEGRDEVPVKDERLVHILCQDSVRDWESGVRGGDDMWKVADRHIASRQVESPNRGL
ncbi:hypothetical protein BDN72DRAFT_843844 [Pluteus cervinus]|uniref:Uncharacterized protein n=1 Tax=Pluteus cervinus TaxID=181527 RepID=A0ACD3AMP9_9AGAR|nr:hypothetical protein BDN72DRAFT_843844 [Pluteus cervinus]